MEKRENIPNDAFYQWNDADWFNMDTGKAPSGYEPNEQVKKLSKRNLFMIPLRTYHVTIENMMLIFNLN